MKNLFNKGLLAFALVAGFAVSSAYAAGMFSSYPAATSPLTGAESIPADTNLPNGLNPQTENITVDQLKGYVFGGYVTPSGTASATAGAATLNAGRGVITSEALTTAAAAVYTLTLTNAAVTANSIVLVSVGQGTNTTVGPALVTATPAAGSVVVTIRNTHASSALNGTIKVGFAVLN